MKKEKWKCPVCNQPLDPKVKISHMQIHTSEEIEFRRATKKTK